MKVYKPRNSQKICSSPQCSNPRRSVRNRYCRECHNAKMRKWREAHPLPTQSVERMKMNCRSYLHVYLKRGKVKKTPCEVCGNPLVEAHHDNHDKPLEVVWLCAKHHTLLSHSERYGFKALPAGIA